MLSIIIPLTMTLLPQINNFWFSSILTLFIIMGLMSMKFYMPLTSPTLISDLIHMDTLSTTLIALTLWVSSMMIIASQKTKIIKLYPNKLTILILSLCLILTLVFSTSNLLLMYLMFEASLIPTLMIILGWGYQPERSQAGMYLMLYTISASLPLLISIGSIFFSSFHLNLFYPFNYTPFFMKNMLLIWWLMTILAFLVKMPMYLTHLWLPKAHVEAPVAGSMILAAVLLKLGGYGIIRLMLMYPMMMKLYSPILSAISAMGATITSLICIRQSDIKSLIAYSSVGHMGLLIMGLMSSSNWAIMGSIIMMIAHGLASSGLFSLANMTYEFTHTRNMFMTKGLLNLFPIMSMMWFIMSCCNMGAPPSINLLSEIMLIASTLYLSSKFIIFISFITFLSAVYTLVLYTSAQHGFNSSFINHHSYYNIRNINTSILHFTPIIMLIFHPMMMALI